MSDDHSPRLSLPFLIAGQAQKEVTHNEALQMLDALIQPVALSADISVPPVTPSVGDCWVIAFGAVGDWTGCEGKIAQWTAGGWRFSTPLAGWRCHVADRSATMVHDGTGWQDDRVRSNGIFINDEKVVGARSSAISNPAGGAIIDDQARDAINEILSMLRGHGLIST